MERKHSAEICSDRRGLLKAGAVIGMASLASCIWTPESLAAGEPLSERPGIAAGRFGGMSCAEALALTYGDLVGLDEKRAKGLGAGFGLGMRRKQTCGAVTVMLMLAGMGGKGGECSKMMDDFEKANGSIQCAYFVDQFGYSRCKDLLRFAGGQLNSRVFG